MILLRWLLNAIVIMVVAYLVPGIDVASIYTALLVALVLGLLNVLIRPLLILLTLPVTILSLGLFVFVINALLIMLAGTIVKGFDVSGFLPALVGALLIWAFGWITNTLLKDQK